MLRVIHGSFDALEPAFIDALKALRGKTVAVVTPSRLLADRLQRLAAVEHGLSLLGVHFHTFFSLAQAVVSEEPPKARLIADPVFHDRLVDQLLGARINARGVAPAMRSSVRDLIDAGVSLETLRQYFSEDEKLADAENLLRLADAYENRLDSLGIMSPSGLTRLAASRVEGSAVLEKFSEVLYYGFYDLTGLQLEFFEAVTSRCGSRLFFPYRKDHPAFRFAQDFFEQKLQAKGAAAAEAAPRPLLEALFSPGAPAVPGAALKLVSASGARDEAWAAAKEVLRLVEREGFAFEEIAVVARTIEPYRHALSEVFAENELPLDLIGGEPLLRRPVAKAALNLLTLRQRDFPALTVDDLFSSPYYNRIARGPVPVYDWRQVIRFLGVHAGWLQWRGKLEKRVSEPLKVGEDYSIAKEDVASLWKLVRGLEAALSDESERSWAGKSRQALQLLEGHLRLPEEPDAEEAAAWESVRSIIESLAGYDLLGGSCGWPDFLEAFEDKMRSTSLDSSTGRRGVRAMGAMDSRGDSYRALIMLGLKEGVFPRVVREDPLLRDQTRARLRHPAGYWIARKDSGHEEERLLFWLCCASARERLVCVYPRSNEAGRAELPSLYLLELCRAAGLDLKKAEPVPRQPAAKLERLDPALASPKEVSLRRALEGGGEWPHLDVFNDWGQAGPLDGLVGPPQEYLRTLKQHGISPSSLDKLAQCGFRFFASKVLRLADDEEASSQGEFTNKARGKIYHAVLEKFYRRLQARDWKDEDQALSESLDEVFRDNDWQSVGVYPVLWAAQKELMEIRTGSFVRWDLAEIGRTGLKPHWLEKKLDGPLDGLDGWLASGVADRVDLDETKKRFRVIDYKLHKPKSKRYLHQLPLYAELAARLLGPDWTLDSSRLYYIDEDDHAGKDELDLEKFRVALKEAAERISRGRFPIKPDAGDFGYCRHCDFSSMCRKSHAPSLHRALTAG